MKGKLTHINFRPILRHYLTYKKSLEYTKGKQNGGDLLLHSLPKHDYRIYSLFTFLFYTHGFYKYSFLPDDIAFQTFTLVFSPLDGKSQACYFKHQHKHPVACFKNTTNSKCGILKSSLKFFVTNSYMIHPLFFPKMVFNCKYISREKSIQIFNEEIISPKAYLHIDYELAKPNNQ